MTMVTSTATSRNWASLFSMSPERRSVLIAIAVFLGLLALVDFVSTGRLSYFDISFLSSGGATSAIAAIGQTIVVLSGGFDLSAGAVISLVNVVLAQGMDPAAAQPSVLYWTCVGIGVGMLTGAFNGIFIAFFRLQPIVVTLSTMFIIQGLTLLVMDKPGGFVAPDLGTFYLGDAIPGWLPMPLVVIGVVLLAWLWLKNTRFGTAIYAVGSDPDAAAAIGVRVKLTKFLVYVIAGGCYGLAGVFISAQTGSADPLVGNPLLLSMFAAVVVGGTRLGGGRGGPLGTVFGAYILMMVVNILLVLNVSAYYSTIAEGTILILAVLAGSISYSSTLAKQLRSAQAQFSAWRQGLLPSQLDRTDRRMKMPSSAQGKPAASSFLSRNSETIRYALPAYLCLLAVVIVTQFWLGRAILNPTYWNSLAVLSTFLAILALGQGTVILTGGLDLSVPWTIGIAGILLAGIVNGSDAALDLRLACRSLHRLPHRLYQRRRDRRPRHIANRHDAGDERHPAGICAGLFAGNTGGIFIANAPLVHDRENLGGYACRSVHGAVCHRCRILARTDCLRTQGLRHRQWTAGGAALGHRRRAHAHSRLCAFRPLCRACRGIAHRLFGAGKSRHG